MWVSTLGLANLGTRSLNSWHSPPIVLVQPPLPPSAPSADAASGKLDRWLSRTEKLSDKTGDSIAAVLGDSNVGGVSACCHLIKLLEAEELIKVKDVLVATMRERGLDGELVEAPKLAAPDVPKNASAATKKLAEVMTHITGLANEAATREQAAAKAMKKAEEEAKALKQAESKALAPNGSAGAAEAGASEGGEGGGKLNRWLKRAEKKAADPKPEEPAGKLGRWIKRAENKEADRKPSDMSAASGAPASDEVPSADALDEAPGSTDPLDVTVHCCKRVRAAWATADKAGGGSAFLREKAKLDQEKRALENLMQMVYAVRNTPEQLDDSNISAMPGAAMGAGFGMQMPGMNGAPPGMLPPMPNATGAAGVGGMGMGMGMAAMPGMMPPGGPPGTCACQKSPVKEPCEVNETY